MIKRPSNCFLIHKNSDLDSDGEEETQKCRLFLNKKISKKTQTQNAPELRVKSGLKDESIII